jgi:hypothetical protein
MLEKSGFGKLPVDPAGRVELTANQFFRNCSQGSRFALKFVRAKMADRPSIYLWSWPMVCSSCCAGSTHAVGSFSETLFSCRRRLEIVL